MLSLTELRSIKAFLLRTQPTQGKSMQQLMPELKSWQECCAAVDREIKAAGQETPAPPEE